MKKESLCEWGMEGDFLKEQHTGLRPRGLQRSGCTCVQAAVPVALHTLVWTMSIRAC